ncbi:WW domain-binding protein 4 [Anoplopoma fimbria]|uniref:WW domain-binding protein 4 n=1 Tax=Anoplopoma fimbria TaxID=229290 RepID=UPI0023ED2B5C|nr:WW domain-binding protein 4 [Anoplopoma fimbria]
MADYWKSQPRKFCQYCKCWIADNKPSVEFHERGKNHKENVAAKISEIKKKSIDKAKQEARETKEFAAMEEAALKAYEGDLKRMERESAGLPALITAQPQKQPQVRPQVRPQARPPAKKQKKQGKANMNARGRTEAQVWVEGQTEDGHAYYYNTITGESKWEKPEVFQGENPPYAQPGQTESSSGRPWMEAVSPDGYTYYYKPETGETSWEKPAGFPSIEASGSATNKEGESQGEPSSPQLEPQPGGEESSGGAPASRAAEVPEQESQQSKVPKISFRKRKAEAEPSEKEGEDKASDDAPKQEAEQMKKEEEVQSTTAEQVKKEEEVQSTTAEPEEKQKEEAPPVKKQVRRPKTANPYGTWEEIQEEEDPYAKVDLQLPQVEGYSVGAPADLPPEPKPKFKERIITSLGGEGGPASFRKNKTQNGKSRSIRQRDDDDD